jgi:ABC-type antimicrobial peptide transport system permease subunit
VRTAQDGDSQLAALISAIHRLDPSLGVYNQASMGERIADSQTASLHRSSAWLAAGFALVALLLSVIGLYGIIAYSVGQRTREIGVRMALGAQRSSVCTLILKEACRLTGTGLVLGVLASLLTGMFLEKLLFAIRPWDIVTLVSVAVVLAFCALLASYIPARRAAGVDPLVALRYE